MTGRQPSHSAAGRVISSSCWCVYQKTTKQSADPLTLCNTTKPTPSSSHMRRNLPLRPSSAEAIPVNLAVKVLSFIETHAARAPGGGGAPVGAGQGPWTAWRSVLQPRCDARVRQQKQMYRPVLGFIVECGIRMPMVVVVVSPSGGLEGTGRLGALAMAMGGCYDAALGDCASAARALSCFARWQSKATESQPPEDGRRPCPV